MEGTGILKAICVLAVFLFQFVLSEENLTLKTSVRGRLSVKKDLVLGHEDWLKNVHVFLDGGQFIAVPK